MFWIALIGLIVSILFNILNYLQNKNIKKASVYIDKLLITPTPENIMGAREEAKYISATSGTLKLNAPPLASPLAQAMYLDSLRKEEVEKIRSKNEKSL
ncbi:MAG: hypothetical protein ABIA97_03900 [Candidatus Omnitrophota bacterium]